MDTPEALALLPEFLRRTGIEGLRVSAETGEGIEEFKTLLRKGVLASRAEALRRASPPPVRPDARGVVPIRSLDDPEPPATESAPGA
jgi:hypothetical protein